MHSHPCCLGKKTNVQHGCGGPAPTSAIQISASGPVPPWTKLLWCGSKGQSLELHRCVHIPACQLVIVFLRLILILYLRASLSLSVK